MGSRRLRSGLKGAVEREENVRQRPYVVAVARDAGGRVLTETHLQGPSIYDLTAELIAWAAERAVSAELRTTGGALEPIQAFGLDGHLQGCKEIGLQVIE